MKVYNMVSMRFTVLIASIAVLALLGCDTNNKPKTKKPFLKHSSPTKAPKVLNKTPSFVKRVAKVYLADSLSLNNILLNGHQPKLSFDRFHKYYPKSDSLKKTLWECGSPFDSLDEAWMINTYGAYDTQMGTFKNYDGQVTTIYVNGSAYATNGHITLLIEADASHNSVLIPSHQIALNSQTSAATFNKLFPKTHPEKMEDRNMIRYRIPLKPDYPDAFLFYFKNGKFDHIELWYLLC
jgi:hypothetical protein